MPDDRGRLFAGDVADMIGIRASDWRARVSRGYAPKPVDYIRRTVRVRGVGQADVTAVAAVWDPAAIAEYLDRRKQRLAGGEQVLQAIERQND